MEKTKIELGSICESLKGHDAGNIYIIIKFEDDYVWLCDGEYKKLNNPKKKKTKHIKILDYKSNTLNEKLTTNLLIHDAEIYSKLKKFREQKRSEA